MSMGISNLDAGTATYFSWTSTNSNQSQVDNHRFLAPYAGKIVACHFVCNGVGISADPTGIPSAAVFSIVKSTAFTTATTFSDTHTDTGGSWSDTIMGGANPDFGRMAPVEDWVGYDWDAGDILEAKVVPGANSGASDVRGTMTMVIQWEMT